MKRMSEPGFPAPQQSEPSESVDTTPAPDLRIQDPEGPSSLVGNKDKAWDMAKAEDAKRNEHAYLAGGFKPSNPERLQRERDSATANAGDKYELELLASKEGADAERLRERMLADIQAYLTYGKQMIENQLRFGEETTPEQDAFVAIADLMLKAPISLHYDGMTRNENMDGDLIVRYSDTSEGTTFTLSRELTPEDFASGRGDVGILRVEVQDWSYTGPTEIWEGRPFKAPADSRYDYSKKRESLYIVRTPVDEEGFKTERSRPITAADSARLKQLVVSIH